MIHSDLKSLVLLGSGGSRPRIDIICPDGRKEILIELGDGHSVYTMDISPSGDTFALGTKSGLVVIFPFPYFKRKDELITEPVSLFQGSPVLSVCWFDDKKVVTSDLSGRVFLWDIKKEREPKLLKSNHSVVCSLTRLDHERIAGICSNGRLFVWEVSSSEPIQSLDLIPPPSKCALVQLQYCEQLNTLYYPGTNGKLVLCNLNEGEKRILLAHEGDLYACFTHQEYFFTIGRFDERLKMWIEGNDRNELDFHAPKGVIGAALYTEHPLQVVLLTEDGKASVHHLGEEGLKPVEIIGNSDFRKVLYFNPQSGDGKSRSEMIHDLVEQIEIVTKKGNQEELQVLHNRLVDMGYEHVSLAIKTEQAVREEEYLEALRFCHRLISLIPLEDPRVCVQLARYAFLLAKFWRIQDAKVICKRISNIDPTAVFPSLMDIPSIPFDPCEKNIIIEPDIDIEQIIEATEILECTFSGNYVVKKLDSLLSEKARITAKEITEKYNAHIEEETYESYPIAKYERVNWISREGWEKTEMIFFEGNKDSDRGIGLSFRIAGAENRTLIIPVILFRWPASGDFTNSHRDAKRTLKTARNTSTVSHQLDSVFRTTINIVRRVVTEAESFKRLLS